MHFRPQKIFRQSARLLWGGAWPRRIFGNLVFEARQFAFRRDLDAELFFLLRAEPAVRPAPEAHPRPHDAVGLLEPGFALEKGLGFVVEIEARRLPVARHLVALARQKPARRQLRILAAHPEINGSLGKGAV